MGRYATLVTNIFFQTPSRIYLLFILASVPMSPPNKTEAFLIYSKAVNSSATRNVSVA